MEKKHKTLLARNGKKYLVKDLSKDMHTQYGFVKAEELKKKAGTILKTNLNKELLLLDTNFNDMFAKIKRGAQIVTLKDIGSIIVNACIDKDTVVIDAGSGSGGLSCYIARYAKKVISFDKRQDHQKIAKKMQNFLD